ncbi:MAG: hypothetical protein AB1752_08070 [Candidatus Zixiibacteriota bacterium]
MKVFAKAALLVGVAALLVSCAKAPEMEESRATQSATTAEQAKAARYAPDAWQMAEDTLQAARTEKAAQDDRFALFRSYGTAKALFERAAVLADEAAAQARQEMERVRQETEVMLSNTQMALDSTAAKLAKARVGKDNKAEIELMKQDIAAFQQQMAEAQADYNAGEYDKVRTKLEAINTRLAAMKL